MSILTAILQIVVLVLKYWLDPDRLRAEMHYKADDLYWSRMEKRREDVVKGDSAALSRDMADALDRVRRAGSADGADHQ